ncbi:hypothetical protein ACFX2I_000060 [Malus domestica]
MCLSLTTTALRSPNFQQPRSPNQRHNSFLAQIEGAVLDLNRILLVPCRITSVRTPSNMEMAVRHQAITYQGKVLG